MTDLHVGTPTLSGLDVPVSQRTLPRIEGPAVEQVWLPVNKTGVQVSLNGCATWRETTAVTGGCSFPVAGWETTDSDAWKLPPGSQIWVWVRSGTQVRRAAQPIVTTGVTLVPQPPIGAPGDAEVTYGHGAPGEMTGQPGQVYIDVDTADWYEWE